MLRRLTKEQQTIWIAVLFAFMMGLVLPYLFHKPFRFLIPLNGLLTGLMGILFYFVGRKRNCDWSDSLINGCFMGHALGASMSFVLISLVIWKATTFLTGGFVFLGIAAILGANFVFSLQNITSIELAFDSTHIAESLKAPVFANRIEELEHKISWANSVLSERQTIDEELRKSQEDVEKHKLLRTAASLFAVGCFIIGLQFLNSFRSLSPFAIIGLTALFLFLFLSRIYFSSRNTFSKEADQAEEEFSRILSDLDAKIRQDLADSEVELAILRGTRS